jgi:lysophospholipase L1-like esterase
MSLRRSSRLRLLAFATLLILAAARAEAQSPQLLDPDATRYLAMGDSIPAGYKAQPATNGYPFLLYQNGVFDRVSRTLFNNIAVVGATTEDVLLYQVPQALIPASEGGFRPQYVTLTVGGNDLASILRFAATNPGQAELAVFVQQTLLDFSRDLGAILNHLYLTLPDVRVFVANQYAVPELEDLLPGGDALIGAFNATVAQVVDGFPSRVHLVDVHGAFLDRDGLLLIERRGAGPFEVHLSNAGQRTMAQAFADVIAEHK